MSALEQFSALPNERRRAPRVRVTDRIPVHLGRAAGTLVDLSLRGARIRHVSAVGRGAKIRLSLEWHGKRFAASAEVVASRIVALDGPTYESRLHFVEVHHECEAVLRQILATIENGDLRRAVENLRGLDGSETPTTPESAAQGFLRCRFFSSGRWDKKWTRETSQPDEGFTLPAALSDFELAQVCRSYERIDPDGRTMLRAIAEKIIAERSGSPA